jgi:hypothetical protein
VLWPAPVAPDTQRWQELSEVQEFQARLGDTSRSHLKNKSKNKKESQTWWFLFIIPSIQNQIKCSTDCLKIKKERRKKGV